MRITKYVMAIAILVLICAGCNFKVKNTEGIKAFLDDQTEVERIALKLKDRYADEASQEYKDTKKLYEDAITSSDKFVRDMKLDIAVKSEINYSRDEYGKTSTRAELQKFVTEGQKMLGMGAAGLDLGIEAGQFVGVMIKAIVDLNNKEDENARKRFQTAINQGYMIEFDKLSREALIKKYKGQ